MPKRTLVVLKLGGSVVTAKNSSRGIVRRRLLQHVGQLLAQYVSNPSHRLVLLHGAGAPGHRLAKRYSLHHGVHGSAIKRAAAHRGQRIMAQLNASIIQSLRHAGVPAVPIHPPSVIRQRGGRLSSVKLHLITTALRLGKVPVLYGDIVPDTRWGLSICSADASGSYLARALKASRLVFATDADGIYTDDPHHHKKATLIRNLNRATLAVRTSGIKSSHSVDVTGGMLGKIRSILLHTRVHQPREVIIFNGRMPNRYGPALRGTLMRCTRITSG